MIKHRICCCNTEIASQCASLIAFALVAAQTLFSWMYGYLLAIEIYQTVVAVLNIVACVLLFVACYTTRPTLVKPMIIMQVWNCLNKVAICVYSIVEDQWYDDLFIFIIFCLLGLLLGLFFLHCHICCYRLLVFKRIAHNNHNCAHDNYAA